MSSWWKKFNKLKPKPKEAPQGSRSIPPPTIVNPPPPSTSDHAVQEPSPTHEPSDEDTLLSASLTSEAKEKTQLGWTVLDKLVLFLNFVNQLLSGFPFQGAVAAPLELLKSFQTHHDNNELLKRLPDHIESIQNIVTPITSSLDSRQSFPKSLEASCKQLTASLEEIRRTLNDFLSQRALNQLLNHEDIAERLAHISTDIGTALLKFNAAGSVELQIEQWRQAPQQLFQWLSPAENSGYDSKLKHGQPDVCLPGTRMQLLATIDEWFKTPDSKPIFWLSGLAGTGKSTISRTLAQCLECRKQLGGSFFFSRWEFNITDPFLVFPTLAYQLALHDDSFLQTVYESRKSAHGVPRSRSLERQFTELILMPLSRSQLRHDTIGIIIDAVDESQDRTSINRLIWYLANGASQLLPSVRLKIFVTSREEPSSSLNFHHFQLHNIEDSIIQNDLTLYLSSRLGELRPPEIATPWPSPEDLAALIAKAEKLFVYAATVVKFVGNRNWSDPQKQLERLLSPAHAKTSPWRDLDDMYRKIVKDAIGDEMDEDLVMRFKLVVGTIILLQTPLPVTATEDLLGTPKEVFPTVKMLHSVFLVPKEQEADKQSIRPFHPSFPEFLSQRCAQDPFFIDEQLHHTRLAATCLQWIGKIDGHPLLERRVVPEHVMYACFHMGDHLSRAHPGDPSLLDALDLFGRQHLLRWAEMLYYMKRYERVTSALTQIHQYVSSHVGSGMLPLLLDDVTWFLSAYLDTIGLRLQQMGEIEYASQVWFNVEMLYLDNNWGSRNFTRSAVFEPVEGGSLRLVSIIPESEKQVEQALTAVEAAANFRRSLLANGQKRFRLSEAWFFSKISGLLYQKRHFQMALVFAEEAVQIHRALSDEHPDTDQVIRVFSVNNSVQPDQSASSWVYLDKLPSDEVFKNLDWFCWEMTTYLHNLSLFCWEMREYDKGLRAVEEAISIQRSAVAKQRIQRNLTYFAEFLSALALFYRQAGDMEKRGLAAEEFVSIYRDGTDSLTLSIPEFGILSRLYHLSSDELQKATIAAELVSLYRALAADQPDGANPLRVELANWLNNLGWALQGLGRFEEGLAAGQESLEITRALAIMTPEGRRNLSAVLDTTAVCLRELGRYEEAQKLGHEAIVVGREVLEANPDHGEAWGSVEITMKNYCNTLESLGRIEEVQKLRKEIEQLSSCPVVTVSPSVA